MSGGSLSSSRKLKILCLHGCFQTKEIFKGKIGSLRKALSKVAELIFVESPNSIVHDIYDTENYKSWWFTSDHLEYISKEPSTIAPGFNASVELLEKFIQDEGPFDGLMGFSQGATFAALICSMIDKRKFKGEFQFVILIAGFKSKCSPHKQYYDNTVLSIPSLHIIGDTDKVISKDRSEELLPMFQEPKVFRHKGGHFVPAAKEAKESYINFLSKFV